MLRIVLYAISRPRCSIPRVYRGSPRCLSNTVSVRVRPLRYAVPWKVGVLLGFGVMGGVSLTAIKYFKWDRTSNCQSQVTSDPVLNVMAAEKTVYQFGMIQRLHLAARFVYLCIIFTPAVTLYLLSQLFGSSSLAKSSWNWILFTLESAGPAFIKLGQWASTRRDLFPDDFCATLSALHLNCHPHSWAETEQLMEANFGPNWQDTLDIEDHTPIGCGCVAQVYRGRLYHHGDEAVEPAGGSVSISSGNRMIRALEADEMVSSVGESTTQGGDITVDDVRGQPVAVKVLHPNIEEKMEQDIFLMKYIASWIDFVFPAVYWVALTECVDEFSIIMEKQVSLLLPFLPGSGSPLGT